MLLLAQLRVPVLLAQVLPLVVERSLRRPSAQSLRVEQYSGEGGASLT